MTNKRYEIIERVPTVWEHQTLWEAVGWGSVNLDMTERSLSNSVYGIVIIHEQSVVGMGRIVGDGVMYFYIQDVAVLPGHQNKGIGKLIIDHLLGYINRKAFTGAFVGLFATQANDAFYEKFGFKDYSPTMTGMFKVIEK